MAERLAALDDEVTVEARRLAWCRSDDEARRELSPEQAAAAAMIAQAREQGLELTGPNGLLKMFTLRRR